MSANEMLLRLRTPGLPVWSRPRLRTATTYDAPEAMPTYELPADGMVFSAGTPPPQFPAGVAPDVNVSPKEFPVYAPSGYDAAAARLRAAQAAEVEGHKGKSLAYGAGQALAGARGSDSLGYMIGAALGGGVSGLVNDKLYGQAKKAAGVGQAKEEMAVEAALDKERRAREEDAAQVGLLKAQAENQRQMPTYRTEEQRRKDEAEQRKAKEANQRAAVSVFNRLDEFDPEDPDNAAIVEQFRAAGVPVVRKERGKKTSIRQDAKTGALYVISDDGTSAVVKAPGGAGQLAITSPQAMTSERAAEALASRERVAKWRIAAQKDIAAQNQAIQRDRVQMSAEQFAKRYPGAGKVLTADDVARKADQLKMLPEDVAKDAVRQGYVIQ